RTVTSAVACDLLSAALFLLITTSSLFGQSGTTGSIFGTVSDKSGAVIPSAEVTATNTQTGVTRDSTTDKSGYYQIGFLPAGQYAVDITAPGFSSFEETSIVLATQNTRVDAALSP